MFQNFIFIYYIFLYLIFLFFDEEKRTISKPDGERFLDFKAKMCIVQSNVNIRERVVKSSFIDDTIRPPLVPSMTHKLFQVNSDAWDERRRRRKTLSSRSSAPMQVKFARWSNSTACLPITRSVIIKTDF